MFTATNVGDVVSPFAVPAQAANVDSTPPTLTETPASRAQEHAQFSSRIDEELQAIRATILSATPGFHVSSNTIDTPLSRSPQPEQLRLTPPVAQAPQLTPTVGLPAQPIFTPQLPTSDPAQPFAAGPRGQPQIPVMTPAMLQEYVVANSARFPSKVVDAVTQAHQHSQESEQHLGAHIMQATQPPVRAQTSPPPRPENSHRSKSGRARKSKSARNNRHHSRLPSDPKDSDGSSSDSSDSDRPRHSRSRRSRPPSESSDSEDDESALPHPKHTLAQLKARLEQLSSQPSHGPTVLSLSNGEQVWSSITKGNITGLTGDQGINYLNYLDDMLGLLGQAVQSTVMGGTHLSSGAVLLTIERQTSRVTGHDGRRWLNRNLPDLTHYSHVYDRLIALRPQEFNALNFWKVYVIPRLNRSFLKANVGDTQRIKAMVWGTDPHGVPIPNANPKSFFRCWYNYWKIVGAGKHILISELCSIIYANFVAQNWRNFDYDKLSDILRDSLNSTNRAFDYARVLRGLESLWRPVISPVDHNALFPKPPKDTGYQNVHTTSQSYPHEHEPPRHHYAPRVKVTPAGSHASHAPIPSLVKDQAYFEKQLTSVPTLKFGQTMRFCQYHGNNASHTTAECHSTPQPGDETRAWQSAYSKYHKAQNAPAYEADISHSHPALATPPPPPPAKREVHSHAVTFAAAAQPHDSYDQESDSGFETSLFIYAPDSHYASTPLEEVLVTTRSWNKGKPGGEGARVGRPSPLPLGFLQNPLPNLPPTVMRPATMGSPPVDIQPAVSEPSRSTPVAVETTVATLVAVLLESQNPEAERIKWDATPEQLRILARVMESHRVLNSIKPSTPVPSMVIAPPVCTKPTPVPEVPEPAVPEPPESSDEEEGVLVTNPLLARAPRLSQNSLVQDPPRPHVALTTQPEIVPVVSAVRFWQGIDSAAPSQTAPSAFSTAPSSDSLLTSGSAQQPVLQPVESQDDASFIACPLQSFAKRDAIMPSFVNQIRQKGVCLQYIATDGQITTVLPARVLPDTCSTVNVMSLQFARENKIPVTEKMDHPLKGIGGAARSGTTTDPVTIIFGQGSNFSVGVVADFYIVDSSEVEFDIILGAQSMRTVGAQISYLSESFTYYPKLPYLDKTVTYSLPLRMSAPVKRGTYHTSQIIKPLL